MRRTIKKQSFIQSIFLLMTSQVIVKILGLIYRLYLTNKDGFGDEGNAIANAGFQIFAIALSIIAIGIPTAISKIVAENVGKGNYKRAYKIFKIALILFTLVGLLCSFLLYFFSDVLAKCYLHIAEAKLSIIALCPSVFLVSIISVFKGFFIGMQSIKMTANAQSLDQLVKTISTIVMIELSILFLKINNTEIMSACSNLATTLGNIAELMYLYRFYRKIIPEIKEEIQYSMGDENIRIISAIKQILIVAIPVSLTALITSISKNIDSTTIVSNLKDIVGYEEAKRQYGILSGKVDVLVNFPLSFNMAIVTALLPTISSNIDNIKVLNKRIKQSFLLGGAISVTVTIFIFIFADLILKILFPNASDGEVLLRISSLQIVFITMEQISTTILNGLGKNIFPIIAIGGGVIIKGMLNWILVPRVDWALGGTIGASLATVICHAVSCIISIIYFMREKRKLLKIQSN